MIAIIIIAAIAALLVIWGLSIYNRLVRMRIRVSEAWSNIDIFLKKRYDMIPNLIETVKGYATHEKELLENVVQLRSSAMQAKNQADRVKIEGKLGKALSSVMLSVENYPDLKANTNFQSLQDEISIIETDIQRSRQYYNGVVRENNVLIESFPSNIIAGMFHFEKGIFLEIDEAETAVPKVSFK